ncbi:MAG: DUF1549 domain-containing protein [Verrucomicrobiota bacterium]
MKIQSLPFGATLVAASCLTVTILLLPVTHADDIKKTAAKLDALIEADLKEQGIPANDPIDDHTFLRRIYLDVAGRIPTIEEAETFHADPNANKRSRLIKDLLHSDGYVSHFYNYWADVLRINRQLGNASRQAESAYQLWVKDALANNMPYDQFVFEMVNAKGYIWDNGAVGYYQRDRGMPLDNMSNTVRIFLGTRLECAQCHDHPFDDWTQMDYYKMAEFTYGIDARNYTNSPGSNRTLLKTHLREHKVEAYQEVVNEMTSGKIEKFPFFDSNNRQLEKFLAGKNGAAFFERNKISKNRFLSIVKKAQAAADKQSEIGRRADRAVGDLYNSIQYISIRDKGDATLKLPHDYQYPDADPHDVVSASTMFGDHINTEEKTDTEKVEAYARWMTSPENPTFTRVIANRLWKKAFGIAVIEPFDELTNYSKPSNPALMQALESLMRELHYDMKGFLEVVYNTKAYQRSADKNEIVLGTPYHFQGPLLRRMSAEQVWDSIVALSLHNADQYRPRLESQLAGIEKQKQIYASLEGRALDDFIAMAEAAGTEMVALYAKQEKLRDQMYKAREAENTEKYNQLRKQLNELSSAGKQRLSEIAYGAEDFKIDGRDLIAAQGAENMMMMMSEGGMTTSEATGRIVTKLAKVDLPAPPDDLSRSQLNAWKVQQRNQQRVYSNLVGKMARASELESPAPRGHFLREFGQSDREVIENAADNASVPQALNLLNGPMVEALTNQFAVFGKRIHEAETHEEKVKLIFQAMLTRPPTERERALMIRELDSSGEKAYESLVWALLNTQQFLFVL